MRTEVRFLVAVLLMLGVLIGTNFLFPPVVPPPSDGVDSVVVEGAGDSARGGSFVPADGVFGGGVGEGSRADSLEGLGTAPPAEQIVTVEGPLYRFELSSYGARVVNAVMSRFEALNHDGLVDLIPAEADGYFGLRVVSGSDTLDLGRAPFRVEPAGGLSLAEGGPPQTLRFVHEGDRGPRVEVEYTFDPAQYIVQVRGRIDGVSRPLLLTELGDGLAFAEADSANEARTMAYVYNHVGDGIESRILERAEPGVVEGPLFWTAMRSKFFVIALLAGESEEAVGEASYLGGVVVRPSSLPDRVHLEAAQPVQGDGSFAYRLFLGPQEYSRLSSLGEGMEEVNPYGWRFFRPIIRPFVSIITGILVFLHSNLDIGYGWVMVIFGLLMRVVLFPLNHKAMKAQIRNMAVQPLLQEIQTKYKDNPEKLQKEVMRLYKEHGFNPFAGCLPMLLPWPVLIALFFVFQNTIELRGVPFLWMPDLSAKDPYYILPILLAASMFAMQWVSMKSIEQPNPQMKMMLWMMPGMMLLIFLNLASGLNLYYVVSNIATIPQQMWIANERKRMQGMPAPRLSGEG